MVYEAGKWVREKNRDGNWFEFVLQKRGNSCGPACVLIMKQLWNPAARYQISEDVFRGLVALAERGRLNAGISAISRSAGGLHDWTRNGSEAAPLVQILKAQPSPITTARTVAGNAAAVLDALQKSSSKRPAIVGWWWGRRGERSNGGHWTVCVGPTKDGRDLTILDPWNGIQYIGNHRQSFWNYVCNTDAGVSTGWFDPNDANDPAVIATY
ncbi:hypothetical protein GWK16_12730 [Roseomonas sp. JC162]|uniref:Peptidase C39-like domain-containing protein n=1 Tax=Neoroseomonas marina TaxID=1232220 RepID=A0A848EDD8_9PROT|nr:hypothetical protein [Neoroseomonas marina]